MKLAKINTFKLKFGKKLLLRINVKCLLCDGKALIRILAEVKLQGLNPHITHEINTDPNTGKQEIFGMSNALVCLRNERQSENFFITLEPYYLHRT